MKNEKGMAFLRNILFCRSDVSLPRYETSKLEKNVFFTKSAAVHNFNIANLPWNLDLNSKSHNMKKWEKNGVSKEYFILSCRTFRCKDMTRQKGGRFWKKTLFHTVCSCTLWPKQFTCLADGGGWREAQHMWDGQGLKDPCFFLNFF